MCVCVATCRSQHVGRPLSGMGQRLQSECTSRLESPGDCQSSLNQRLHGVLYPAVDHALDALAGESLAQGWMCGGFTTSVHGGPVERDIVVGGHPESHVKSPDKLWPCGTRRVGQGAKHPSQKVKLSLQEVAIFRLLHRRESHQKARWQSVLFLSRGCRLPSRNIGS